MALPLRSGLLRSGGLAREEFGHELELPDGQIDPYDRRNQEEGRGEVAFFPDSFST